MFHSRTVPHATYVLTDFDRMGPWELELASHLFRTLKAAGLKVLNDPAKFKPRHALLKHLEREGFNSFTCWSPAHGGMPDRFPVFLRTQAAHRGPLSELLHSPSDAAACLDQALQAGHALNDLLFVEYAAEPIHEGLFAKQAAFRIGDSVTPGLTVFSGSWAGKINEDERNLSSFYEQERKQADTYPFADQVMQIFQSADIDYGRIDFGIHGGRLETYEINTNPWMGRMTPKSEAARPEVKKAVRKLYIEALHTIDSPASSRRVSLDSEVLQRQRHRDHKWLWTRRWTP